MKAKTVSVQNCTEVPGEGIYCGDYYLGNPSALGISNKNSTTVLAKGKEIIGEFHLEESIKDKVKDALDYLRRKGIRLVMVTGDGEESAKRISTLLGIEEFYAKVKPDDKLAILEKYQSMGYRVGMVGDGINDAPAMAKAHVSFAVGSGTDIAKRVCDVVILSGLQGIKDLFEITDKVSKRIKQNLFWAFFYNTLGIPIAGGLFSSYGIVLKPEIAGLMMVLSSLSIVINSIRK
jgi:Cu2+-exporting ATPase/Cu+-exporting ATPase